MGPGSPSLKSGTDWAAKVQYKRPLEDVLLLYQERLKQNGITLVRGEATAEWVVKQKADFVVLATGSIPFIPPVTGLELIRSYDFGNAIDGEVRERNVAVLGGGATGCETAEILMHQGKNVIILEMLDQLAGDLGNVRPLFLERMNEIGLQVYTGTRIWEIQKDRIIIQTQGKVRSLEGIEALVISCGVAPNNLLERQLQNSGVQSISVGDCRKVRNGFWAIRAGFELGMSFGAEQMARGAGSFGKAQRS